MTRREQYVLAWRMAAVSGVLAAAVALLMLLDFATRTSWDPLNSPEYVLLKTQLMENPQDEALQQSLRGLDRQMREAYFDRRHFAAWGTWLLLGSVVLCLASAKRAATLRRRLPEPQSAQTDDDPELRERRAGRWCVAVVAGLVAALAIGLYAGFGSALPTDMRELAALATDAESPWQASEPLASAAGSTPAADGGGTAPEAEAVFAPASDLPELTAGYPDDAEIQSNWPRFRGPGGLGIAPYTNIPTRWDAESGEGILWKTPISLPGNSSPIVWGDRVFVTGADEQTREVYCIDADSGRILWQQPLVSPAGGSEDVPEVMPATGFAASTPATDGRRVYAMFATGDLGAFDFDGNLRWQRSLGVPKNAYGHASSLDVYRDLVLVQYDQGTRNDGLSKLIALAAATGETVWETVREVPNSWSSPIVIHVDQQPQIITTGAPWIIAYAPEDGREIWRANYLHGDVGPSPTFANGVVFAANEFPGLGAFRADGTGDVSETHLLWEADWGVPDTCSPLATDEFVFLAASYGILTCYDVREGDEPLWEQEFDANFVSSPSLVADSVFLFGEEGEAWIIEPAREEARIVAENSLGQRCVTSPAFQHGRMYIRGEQHLFCIGTP